MRYLLAALLASTLALLSYPAAAQPYPSRTVRIIVPFAPGGGVDVVARVLAGKLSEALKQPFIVDNRPGGNGTIGGVAVAKSAPDGYMLLLSASTHVISGLVMKNAPYDVQADFTPITRIGNAPLLVVVHPSVPARSMRELVQLKDRIPGGLSWAVASIGAADHLIAESMRRELGLPLTIISYRGQAPAITDTVGGQVSGMSSTVLPILAHVKDGRLRPLAVTSATRNVAFPDVPTLAESGMPGFELTSWYGLWGPKGLPQPIAEQLAATVRKEFQGPDIIKRFPPESFELVASTREEFERFIQAEIARYSRIVRDGNISIDNM
ncbi:MAG TPA: tripartite tricarboxylate transporter substrate binding protein [Burkholderiales bacterium]|jgi:tripartite-type tricarboxylate transporter receptor subunit TctC|nr:tripartite tricarboxylate transporter substrate binding protein [Burkholderiales bacterium]